MAFDVTSGGLRDRYLLLSPSNGIIISLSVYFVSNSFASFLQSMQWAVNGIHIETMYNGPRNLYC